jgi:hypothetical protein
MITVEDWSNVKIEAIHIVINIFINLKVWPVLDQPSSLSVINNCVEGFISVFFVEKKSSFKRPGTE